MTAGPARADFTIVAGRDEALSVIITDGDDVTPLDLTGCSLEWVVSRGPGQTALVSKSSSTPAEITITSPATNGEATINIVPADTKDLGGATYSHEMVVTGISHAESTVMTGLVTITKSLIN